MNFVKVTAQPCNPQGDIESRIVRTEFHLNKDLIGAINGTTILLKGGNIIALGKNHYTDLQLAQGIKIEDL